MIRHWLLAFLVATFGTAYVAAAEKEAPYDLLLKGGRVIDPKNRLDAVRDVAIAHGKIARVAVDIPAEQAWRVIPVQGLYVVPGLLDMHVHVYAGTGEPRVYAGDMSVYPDGHTFRSGVTTVVDAGTSGHRNFFDFKRRVIDRSGLGRPEGEGLGIARARRTNDRPGSGDAPRTGDGPRPRRPGTRILALLNIVPTGMGSLASQQVVDDMDPQATAAVAKKNPDVIVGIKGAHFRGPEWASVERAVEAGRLANLPVMIDFGLFPAERPYQQLVLEKLRPGDICTHICKQYVPFFDKNGKLLPYLAEGRKRGVKYDVGHGGGGFSWYNAVGAVRQGWLPDTISTDLHTGSMNGGMKDMLHVMSKFLALDVPLGKVIEMSTWNPAQAIRRTELGHLSVGAGADVAVLGVRTGDFGFLDVRNVRVKGTKKLECELTLRDGRVAWDLNGRAGEEYRDPPFFQSSTTKP